MPFPRPPRDKCGSGGLQRLLFSLDDWRERAEAAGRQVPRRRAAAGVRPDRGSLSVQWPRAFLPAGEERERLIGRAESIRDGYLDKFHSAART